MPVCRAVVRAAHDCGETLSVPQKFEASTQRQQNRVTLQIETLIKKWQKDGTPILAFQRLRANEDNLNIIQRYDLKCKGYPSGNIK